MSIDIAIWIYLIIVAIIGLWKGLLRQLIQIISLLSAIIILYFLKEPILAVLAERLQIQGFASRILLLAPLIAIWLVIYLLLVFTARPLMKRRRRISGAILAVIKGLVVVMVVLMLCDLAYPTLELRFPKVAEALSNSTFFNCVRRLDQSKLDPFKRWAPIKNVRDIFRAPIDYAAWERLKNDPNYRDFLSTKSLSNLGWDEDFIKSILEGRYKDAALNPKLRAFINDEEAYRAFTAFIWAEPSAETKREFKRLRPFHGAIEEIPLTREADKYIILKNGRKFEGIIRSQNEREITADIVIGSGITTVTFRQEEILEIRDIITKQSIK